MEISCVWLTQDEGVTLGRNAAGRAEQNLDESLMSGSALMESITLLNCLQESSCEACLRPCNQLFLGDDLCKDACRLPNKEGGEEDVCSESCRFLKQINSIRPGTCPPETRATGSAALCIKECYSDADCNNVTLKCCSNSCGWTCQQPNHMYDGMPEIPEKPFIRERSKSGSVEIKWKSVAFNSSSRPVLYLVDSRSNVGRLFNESNMTKWHQIAQTTGTLTVLSDLVPGHWYQFRVMSVNIYGSQGGSLATIPFTLSKEPKKPGPPSNLTEGDAFITNGKVSVLLHWFPPKKSDLPISRYKIYWSKKLKTLTSHLTALREYRQVLPGDRLSFQIPELEPDTTYFVQVQAICVYGDMKLKSEKASIAITTYPLPRSAEQMAEMDDVLSFESSTKPRPTPASVVALNADKPFYHNGILKANISWTTPEDFYDESDGIEFIVNWSPEACIADAIADTGLAKVMSSVTQGNFLVLFDLRFDCRYVIRVEPINSRGMSGHTSNLTLTTPSCHHVNVVGKIKPECPNSVVRIPQEPRNLQHSFLISNSNITAKLIWEISESEVVPLIGFRVVWGILLQSHNHDHTGSKMDKTSSLTRVLPKDVRSINIGGLTEATTYVAQIQSMSKTGPSRMTSIQFMTPLLQQTPVGDPSYHELDVLRNDYGRKQEGNSRRKQEISAVLATSVVTTTMLGLHHDNVALLRNVNNQMTSKSIVRNSASYVQSCLLLTVALLLLLSLSSSFRCVVVNWLLLR